MHRHFVTLLLVLFAFIGLAFSDQRQMIAESQENLLFFEDFSLDMNNWWVEGGDKVWIQHGRLYVRAVGSKNLKSNVCTVWCKSVFPGDVQIEFDAHVISSPKNVNNINFFLSYSDPSGVPMYETRQQRSTGKYALYHQLNGYIFTFLNDVKGKGSRYSDGSSKARFRMRRCPDFHLIKENFGYHCRQGVTYHITITKRGNRLTYGIDGKVYLIAYDNKSLAGGLIGLRTYSTFLWWDNIEVRKFN
jgi:Domain of unknown function (DUF6250)